MSVDPPPQPVPPNAFVRQRRIPARRIEWVHECDGIMAQFGAVSGAHTLPVRHQARYRAQSLIRLMVELGLRQRSELVEHTDQTPKGFTWTVEYRPRLL